MIRWTPSVSAVGKRRKLRPGRGIESLPLKPALSQLELETNSSLVGYLVNMREGRPPTRDFSLFRIAAMDEVLRDLGARLFVYSPRQIDPGSGLVDGLLIEDGRFVSATAPVPLVNGSWFIGRDRSSRPRMTARQFRDWAAGHGIDVYPLQSFSRVLKDKLRTSRMIRDFDPALHPQTEAYDSSLEQLNRFVGRYRSVFVKPRFGSKGNDIFALRRAKRGLHCAYYSARQMQEITFATPADALANLLGDGDG